MKGREFKNVMYDGLSKLMKALANPARLEIIEMLSQGERNVEGIAETTGLTIANASQHLQVLKNNSIVKSRKEGHYVFYSLANDDFPALYQHIITYAINEVAILEKTLSQQRKDHLALNAVTLKELEAMVTRDDIVLMDVRPAGEYELGHINGAVSVPMNELLDCLKELSKEKEIIAYCRGPFCVLADVAVKILTENGFKVRRLNEGFPEWKIKHLQKENEAFSKLIK